MLVKPPHSNSGHYLIQTGIGDDNITITQKDNKFQFKVNEMTTEVPFEELKGLFIHAGSGNDIIDLSEMGNAKDTILIEIFAGDGDDTVEGSSGDDIIHGGLGSDILNGNEGDDLIFGGDLDYKEAFEKKYQLFDVYLDGDDVIHGGYGDDHIFGMSGNDQLYGDGGTDIIEGGQGNDYLNPGSGKNDQTIGGIGKNIYARDYDG